MTVRFEISLTTSGCPHGAKEKCEHEQGTYNSHECKCYPKKKTCDEHKVKECEKWGGEFNHEHCACYPKKEEQVSWHLNEPDNAQGACDANEQCKDWLRLLICKKLGKSCSELIVSFTCPCGLCWQADKQTTSATATKRLHDPHSLYRLNDAIFDWTMKGPDM